WGGSTIAFTNAGTLAKTAGSGTTTVAVYLGNSGTVRAQNGTIQISGDGDLGGVYQADSGAAIYFAGNTYTLKQQPDFQGPGTVQIDCGNLIINGTVTNLSATCGTIAGLSNVVGSASLTNCTINGQQTIVGTANLQ